MFPKRVVSHVRGKVALDFDNLGEQRLKNMAEPVGVYRVRMAGAPQQRRCSRFATSVDCRPAFRT